MDFGVMRRTQRGDQTQGRRDMLRNFIWSFGVPSCLCKKRDDWREASFEYGVQPHHLSMICVAWNCLTGTFPNLAKRLSRWSQQALDLDGCQVTRQSDQTQKSRRKHSSQSHDGWDHKPCAGSSTHNSGLIRWGGLPQGRQGPQPPASQLNVDGKLRFKLTWNNEDFRTVEFGVWFAPRPNLRTSSRDGCRLRSGMNLMGLWQADMDHMEAKQIHHGETGIAAWAVGSRLLQFNSWTPSLASTVLAFPCRTSHFGWVLTSASPTNTVEPCFPKNWSFGQNVVIVARWLQKLCGYALLLT